MTASRAILISRRRRGRPLNLNLDDATFGKPKSSVIPFSREHVLRFCVRARACKKNKKETRDVKLVFLFLFFYSCLWIRSVARSKSSGCVRKCVQMCAAFLPKYLFEIFVTFFFLIERKDVTFLLHFCPRFAQKHPLNARIEADHDAQKARRNGSFEKWAFVLLERGVVARLVAFLRGVLCV
jgi:hypothetical protein